MNTYSNRLDSEIKGPGFEKTWDQLWRGGYLKTMMVKLIQLQRCLGRNIEKLNQ